MNHMCIIEVQSMERWNVGTLENRQGRWVDPLIGVVHQPQSNNHAPVPLVEFVIWARQRLDGLINNLSDIGTMRES